MDEKKQKFSISVLKELIKNTVRLSRIVWREERMLIAGTGVVYLILSFFSFAQSGAMALLINELVKTAGTGSFTANVFFFLILVIIAGFVPSILNISARYFEKILSFFLEAKFQSIVLEAQASAEIAAHENVETKNLLNRVMENGTYRIENFVVRQYFVLQNILEVVIASIVLAWLNPWIFFLIFVGMVPELINEVTYGQGVWGIFQSKGEVKRKFYDTRTHFYGVSDIIELKLFQNIKYFIGIINDLFKSFQDEQKKNERKKLTRDFLVFTLSQITIVVATIWFITQVIQGEMQIGTLTFAIASIAGLRQALSGFFANIGRQYEDNLFVTDVFSLIDLVPTVQIPENGKKIDTKKTPEIIFDNVTFSYLGSKVPVLKNFSLTIRPGEKLAVIGVNGAGKTTFVKLLCRFYDPQEGNIIVGGINLKEMDLKSWYYQIGALFQEYSNYHFTVKESIGIGKTDVPLLLEQVKKSAEASEAHIFIEEWEKQYEQQLSTEYSEGKQPSVGQWQKLALARAFYRDPNVLILDEPTSSIDAEAEAKIFKKLEKLPKNKTVILISHRFSTVRQADTIVVIEDGKIAEKGTHKELLKLKKTYAKLFALQAKGYK